MGRVLVLCCAVAVIAFAFTGCSSQAVTPKANTVFLAPDYASMDIETVALLPMANVTGDPDAEKIMGNGIESHLIRRDDYEFMTVERLRRSAQAAGLSGDLESLRRKWVHTRQFDSALARKLADELKIDAFLVGEITKWKKMDLQPQETGYPQTNIGARVYLMNARTGDKLWEATADRLAKGQYYDPSQQEVTQYMDEAGIVRGSGGKPVQTVEAPSLREVAEDVAADIVTAIPKKAGSAGQ